MKIKPNNLRKHVLDMVYEKQSGHIGGSFSLAEIIAYLYENYDLVDGNDKLILSKGHAVPILYAVLYELGFLKTLEDFREVNSSLQGHPDKQRLSYMHATTGALGQGLSIGIGHAIAYKMQYAKNINNKVFCILGDGEIQEGQVWEAFMLAPKYQLDNLICIVDYNKAQNDGFVKDILDIGDLSCKIESFGWEVVTIDGHNMQSIEHTFKNLEPRSMLCTKPICVILDTVKGKGVSFMETPAWHAKVPSQEEYTEALKELSYESNS
jgi:transketolase|tara:strand:- start:1967 stop:2764 length:798 start_codon:yes stop_codon:yes gene_type:complete